MGGINYLMPVDAKRENDRDVRLEAVPLDDQVMSAIEGARTLRLVILDACRTDRRRRRRTDASPRASACGCGFKPTGRRMVM